MLFYFIFFAATSVPNVFCLTCFVYIQTKQCSIFGINIRLFCLRKTFDILFGQKNSFRCLSVKYNALLHLLGPNGLPFSLIHSFHFSVHQFLYISHIFIFPLAYLFYLFHPYFSRSETEEGVPFFLAYLPYNSLLLQFPYMSIPVQLSQFSKHRLFFKICSYVLTSATVKFGYSSCSS